MLLLSLYLFIYLTTAYVNSLPGVVAIAAVGIGIWFTAKQCSSQGNRIFILAVVVSIMIVMAFYYSHHRKEMKKVIINKEEV